MKILVCGGRDYDDKERVFAALDTLNISGNVKQIIQGGARGADRLAKRWATMRGVDCVQVDADWATHGRAAGMMRNQRMLDECKPNLVLAFPGGAGTAGMVRIAKRAKVKTVELKP